MQPHGLTTEEKSGTKLCQEVAMSQESGLLHTQELGPGEWRDAGRVTCTVGAETEGGPCVDAVLLGDT